jgi:hypothetical protein
LNRINGLEIRREEEVCSLIDRECGEDGRKSLGSSFLPKMSRYYNIYLFHKVFNSSVYIASNSISMLCLYTIIYILTISHLALLNN